MATRAITTDDSNLRFVDESGKVLYIRHDYDTIPPLGSEHQILDEVYRVVSIQNMLDGNKNLRHVKLTVELV